MTAAVYDYIFKGVVQPLIGTFSIPLGDMITQTSQEMDRRIEKLTKMYYQIQALEESNFLNPFDLLKSFQQRKQSRLLKKRQSLHQLNVNFPSISCNILNSFQYRNK